MTATRCTSYTLDADLVCQLDDGHAGDHRAVNVRWADGTPDTPPPTTGPVNLTAGQLYTDHRYDGPAVRHVRGIGGMKLDPPAVVESVRLTTSWGVDLVAVTIWTPAGRMVEVRLEPSDLVVVERSDR